MYSLKEQKTNNKDMQGEVKVGMQNHGEVYNKISSFLKRASDIENKSR